jgi:hypothetical protein
MSSAEEVENHGTQEEDRMVQVQVASVIAFGFVLAVEGGEH